MCHMIQTKDLKQEQKRTDSSCRTDRKLSYTVHESLQLKLVVCFLPVLLQTPVCWYVSWQAALQVPWRCPLHNPLMWSRFDSKPRWTWTALPDATTAQCRPTDTSSSMRASVASGKVLYEPQSKTPQIHYLIYNKDYPASYRNSTQHHKKRTRQLYRAGHIRSDQGGHS